jgi:hypothetical protein
VCGDLKPKLCACQGDGSEITVEPGLIGGEVNRILAAHAKKGNHPIQVSALCKCTWMHRTTSGAVLGFAAATST